MSWLWIIIVLIFCIAFIKALCNSDRNRPTWTGIIISAMFGMLPLYLVLCFFNILGEKK